MSGVSALPAQGLLATLAGNGAAVKAQLDAALVQQSTGLVSADYAGLGRLARASLDLSPALKHVQTWQSNIDAAQARLSLTQTTLSEVNAIATRFHAQAATVNGLGSDGLGELTSAAKQALGQVAQLLNTQSGGVYLFAGQNATVAPLPSTDPAVVGADVLASDTATAPFASGIGPAVPLVEVGEGQLVQAGVLATANTLAVSAAPTTGSYLRDVMRGLAMLAGLTDTSDASQAVAADAGKRLGSAVDAMADETGALGAVQASLTDRRTALDATATTLSKQVSDVQEVDMAAVLTKVSALQAQLQASYQALAAAKGLSLANYL